MRKTKDCGCQFDDYPRSYYLSRLDPSLTIPQVITSSTFTTSQIYCTNDMPEACQPLEHQEILKKGLKRKKNLRQKKMQ